MQPDKYLPGSPQEWLRHAYSDLELARAISHPRVLLEGLCFHTQQAAEKALKSVLIAQNTPFPRTHNIRTLLDLLPEDMEAPNDVQRAVRLTAYAVSSRYPGITEPIDEERASGSAVSG